MTTSWSTITWRPPSLRSAPSLWPSAAVPRVRRHVGPSFGRSVRMPKHPFSFSSESVTEGHPDKLADQISDAVLDAILQQDPHGRVACETLLTTGVVVVAGEITTETYIEIPDLVRRTLEGAGYTRAKYGFDYQTCGVLTSIQRQSADIALGVDTGRAGDRGTVLRQRTARTTRRNAMATTW